MIQTKNKTIAGRDIMVTQYPGRKSIEIKAKLFKLLGSSLVRLFSGTEAFDLSSLSSAIDIFIDKLNPKEFTAFVLELLQSTRIDGKEITDSVFDTEFAGEMSLMYKILGYTLEVNYGNFFGEAGIGKILTKMKTPPPAKTETLIV